MQVTDASTTPSVPLPQPIDPVPVQTIIPTINRYFYIATANINLTNGATISATLFQDDNSNPVTEFAIFNPNEYVNLYINAMMQEGGFYTVTSNALILEATNATIFARTPIIVETLGFSINAQ